MTTLSKQRRNAHFEAKLNDVFESVIDPAQPTLSPYVFDEANTLRPKVRFEILKVWEIVENTYPTTAVYIVGGISTYNYSAYSDIDVTIQVESEKDHIPAKKTATAYNGAAKAGPHEINYFVRSDFDVDNYDSIYDVIENSWIKGPAEVGVSLNKYWTTFQKVTDNIDTDRARLFEDLVDLIQLKYMQKEQLYGLKQAVQNKTREIDESLHELANSYDTIFSARQAAFDETDITRIEKYGSKNALPENVIYLLLRRHCYIHFLHEIKKALVNRPTIKNIMKSYNKFNKCSAITNGSVQKR